jgi:hypothetical protein
MKRLYILSTLLLLLATSQYSCKPEPTPSVDPIFTALPKDIKDYCVFKYGSYWIYQDSVSGALDTVTVQSYKIDTVNYPLVDGQLLGINETFSVSYYHSHDGFTETVGPFAVPPPPPYPYNNTFNIYLSRRKLSQVNSCYIMIYPFKENQQIIQTEDTLTLLSKNDSTIVYSNKTHVGFNNSEVINIYVRNLGIKRREIKKLNQVWKLIDFHVNQ